VIVRVLISCEARVDALPGVFQAIGDYPGPDEIEIVVVDPPNVWPNRVRKFRVDAADPRFIACLSEWGDVGLDPVGDREEAA
jgi:hypothetical protein